MNESSNPRRENAVRIITVAGQIGSGKTEVCNEIGRRTDWKIVSAGVILRRMASEKGMSILEFNEFAKTHKEIDREIDGYLASLHQSTEPLIVDSRLAWRFLPNSFKVYLVVEPAIGANRVYLASRADENHASPETAGADNAERQRLEQERFFSLYAVNPGNWRNYDLVIDTTHASPGEVADVIMNQADGLDSPRPDCWLSPRRLVPTKEILEPAGERREPDRPPISVAVYDNAFLIVDGHARASAALALNRKLIECRLAAIDNEEVFPGVSAAKFAVQSSSLRNIHAWESAHDFRMLSYPRWIES
ncbi:MAG TPA: AAA family ATPase [Bryobacteraceae bacterium]|nr:AAA family ATPase [Bryobacteraceae bacterium]